jgi:uncharacterized protein YjbI with pentapeptide repeats
VGTAAENRPRWITWAAVFAHDERMVFLDEPTQDELDRCPDDVLVVATMAAGANRGNELALEPWGQDELIEYLLVKHREACSSVIRRLGPAADWFWAPEVACIVLERFAADQSLSDPNSALMHYVTERLPSKKLRTAAERYCLAVLCGRGKDIETAVVKLSKAGCPQHVRKLFRHEIVQLSLAGKCVTTALVAGNYADLRASLPVELVELVGQQLRANHAVLLQLNAHLISSPAETAHGMAASILLAADCEWRPPKREVAWILSGGIFRNAQWSDVDLSRAALAACDFRGANLSSCELDDALASQAMFDDADLRRASLIRIYAEKARFCQCNLEKANMTKATIAKADFSGASLAGAALMMADMREANFSATSLSRADLHGAQLSGATFENADLANAVLRQANLTGTDLRNAQLQGACLEKAVLNSVQMEDIHLTDANMCEACLRDAHLTGSVLPKADLRRADLRGAGLAEIDWEGADLRGANLQGATFHMGSSRSGLVGSPIACEGSRTGFYTDDIEDLSFRRPEEVRNANLRGADLRGANLKNLDFYLVDLRDAKLDPGQRNQARQTGAILEDYVA